MAKAIFEVDPRKAPVVADTVRQPYANPTGRRIKIDTDKYGFEKWTIPRQMTDAERYPRGFTPAQMQEVTEQEQEGKLSISSDSTSEDGRLHPEHEKTIVRQHLARSSITPRQFFNSDDNKQNNPVAISVTNSLPKVKGHIVHGLHRKLEDSHLVKVSPKTLDYRAKTSSAPRPATGSTIFHELGHVAIHRAKNERRTRIGINNAAKGKDIDLANGISEGRADSLGQSTFVPHPREAKSSTETPYQKSIKTGARSESFVKGYNNGRYAY